MRFDAFVCPHCRKDITVDERQLIDEQKAVSSASAQKLK